MVNSTYRHDSWLDAILQKTQEQLGSPVNACKWAGFYYLSSCPMFDMSISAGQHTPYTGEMDIVRRYINETGNKSCFVDVGAHIGTHSIPFSKMFSKVKSFEPCVENFSLLEKNVNINNCINIQIHNTALSDDVRSASVFRHSDHNTGQHQVVDDPNGSIETATLDSYQFENVDYIKIDVEGRELDVLKGAQETISLYRPLIQFEIPVMQEQYQSNLQEIIEFLTYRNYELYEEIHMDMFFRYMRK